MYASHRDACILSKYAAELTCLLDGYYKDSGLDASVIAYRSLGKANYHFSADAQKFAAANAPCIVLCFDVTGFFDNLDHRILKHRLKKLLNVEELPPAWHKIFRHVTRFHHVRRDALEVNPKFGPRMKEGLRGPIATIAEVIAAGIKIHPNKNSGVGIPQGTPISSAFSNLYLMDFDQEMNNLALKEGALYQRYSDDILLICPIHAESALTNHLVGQIALHNLKLNDEKTERVVFGSSKPETIQYLGFDISPDGATIRASSLAKQWRKARRGIHRAKKIGADAMAKGKAKKIYTKKLRKRFTPIGVRNFSLYARKSANAFGNKKILRQVKRFERMMDNAIRELNS